MALRRTTIYASCALAFTMALGSQPLLAADEVPNGHDELALYFDQTEQTTTGALKPISQVAENVSIVTAEEIAAMHAHTLGEVLARQAGVFVAFDGRDYLGGFGTRLLASRRQHVLFLLDGVRINLNSNGYALPTFIPLTIIQRIEIIKGPASSTWGSSLGGVVNIITKDVGRGAAPTGSMSASYGEHQSRDISAEAAGGAGRLGYYLAAGNLDSNGLALDRYAERDSAYGKLELQLPHHSMLTATAGYSDPFYRALNWGGAWGGLDLYEEINHRNIWGTLMLDTELTGRLSLHAALQRFANDYAHDFYSQGTGLDRLRGDRVFGEQWDDAANSLTSRLTWTGEALTANLGFESSRASLDYENRLGGFFGGPLTTSEDLGQEERRGVYVNATWVLGRFSLTPGLRYDYNSNSDEFVSPSLGATCQLAPDTLLRASVARGFSAPYLQITTETPDVGPETVWAYQAGVETGRIPSLRLKATLFHQKVDDAWYIGSGFANAGTIRWNGAELEAQTMEYHGLQLTTNFTFVTEDSRGNGAEDRENDETYTANVILEYRNREQGWRAELAGHYYWMNKEVINEKPRYDDFLWDALLSKELPLSAVNAELFIKAHNLFNASQYWDFEYPNPDRWVEAGLVLKF